MVERHAVLSARQLTRVQELLGVLPDLAGMRPQREPETNEIGLKKWVSRATWMGRSDTHQKQDPGTEVHQCLHRRLVERVVNWIGILVVAMLAGPGTLRSFSGAALADKLELGHGDEHTGHAIRRASLTFPYVW